MKLIVFVVCISLSLLGTTCAQNYCDPTLCPAGVTNIGCNNTGALGAACPADAAVVVLTTAMKQALVQRHNFKRNQIASGNLTGFLPAVRMATIRWNPDLATQAGYNAIRCIYGHDQCRATTQFIWSGQNIAKTWWSSGSPDPLTIMLPQIDAFWSENSVAYMAEINSYPSSPNATIGHFTVITAEKNTAVGCAAITYTDSAMNNWPSLTMVCNYARTNIVGLPMYQSGPTGSKCTTGMNPNYPALCSLSEPYNVNLA